MSDRCDHHFTCCQRWPRVIASSALLITVMWISSGVPITINAQPTVPQAEAAIALDKKLIADAKTAPEVMANLTYLSDVIGPRLTGSANLKRANDWTAEKFKSYGLTNVALEPWELPVAWERGTAYARIVEPENGMRLTVASQGWTPGTDGRVVGDVVIVNGRSMEELKKYEGKLKNAIVLRGDPANVRPITDLSGAPGSDRPSRPKAAEKTKDKSDDAPSEKGEQKGKRGNRPAGFDNRGEDFMRNRREMAEFFRTEGVVCLLNDAGKPHGLLTMTGSWGGRDRVSGSDPLPTLFVTHDHYAMLHRLASRPAPAKTRVEIEISNKLIPGPIAVFNTVGEIRGSEKPDELVVVGAHLDSWDLAQGTTDNGTGSCVVMEAARILAKCGVAPKRTIRFVLFSGEEQGLRGSREYVRRHKHELEKASAALIHDTGTGKIIGLSLQNRESVKAIMEAELTSLKELGVTDFNLRSSGGSDHMSFEGEGVPGFMFRQDPVEYRLTHHSQSDTLDKARGPDLIQGAQVMSVLAMRLANRDQLLPRDKPETASKKTEAKKSDPK